LSHLASRDHANDANLLEAGTDVRTIQRLLIFWDA
jgi:site-specific recombinase XerD